MSWDTLTALLAQTYHGSLRASLASLTDTFNFFLESCSSSPSMDKVQFSLLSFDSFLQSILDGTFNASLPSAIQKALPTPEEDTNRNGNKRPAPDDEKDTRHNKKGSPPGNQHRGDPVSNESIFPAWQLGEDETYAENFVRRIDQQKLPTCNICLNFHMQGSCHTKCSRAATHVPADQLSPDQKKGNDQLHQSR
jgi:hypothetical protein